MDSIGSFEAKTHLAALLERVSRGESIVITKHGRPVARLVPPDEAHVGMTAAEAIAGLLEFRKSHPIERELLKTLVQEGRKY